MSRRRFIPELQNYLETSDLISWKDASDAVNHADAVSLGTWPAVRRQPLNVLFTFEMHYSLIFVPAPFSPSPH